MKVKFSAMQKDGTTKVMHGTMQDDRDGRMIWSDGNAYIPEDGWGERYARENSRYFFVHGEDGAEIKIVQ